VAENFKEFEMAESIGGLDAGSPISIQAMQHEIQTIVDAGTSVSEAKKKLEEKINQAFQQMA